MGGPFETSAPHAGAHSFDDQVALEFADGADGHDDGPAQRATSVDLLSKADELDVQPVQLARISRKCSTDRAIRSEAQTRMTSKRPRRASFISWSSPGRRAFATEIRSVNSATISKPR